MKNSLTRSIRTWAQGRAGRFLLTQLTHTTTTVAVLAALLLGAARVGALDGVLAPLAAPAASTSFTTVNYQGRLADSGGSPIDNTNPGLGMTFALYDVESGGSPVWVETHANVPVSEGLFSVRLGSIAALDTSHLTGDRWLGIQVGTDPEMSPREKLAAVPYAIQAGYAAEAAEAVTVSDGSISTEKIADGAITNQKLALSHWSTRTTSNVGISSTSSSSPDEVLSLSVDFPADGVYLVIAKVVSRSHADDQLGACVWDESGLIPGSQIFNTHPVSYDEGRETGTSVVLAPFSAGTHTIRLMAWISYGSSAMIPGTHTQLIVIPLGQP